MIVMKKNKLIRNKHPWLLCQAAEPRAKSTFTVTLSLCILMALCLNVSAESYTGNHDGSYIKPVSANQALTVSGKVTDAAGQPLAGVSIKEKGTGKGVSTKEDGSFKIVVADENAVLQVSYIGFEGQEISVKGQRFINIVLQETAQGLQEVVVVGYGTQRKADVTGAVASVNLESFREAPNTNIGQYLQGTVPGLNVGVATNAGGTPPISIRGQVTLSGNRNVLIILDGIQYNGSLSSINPDDIASIDVLKDASSTAVYGAQAANGVILITSRKGQANQKPRI